MKEESYHIDDDLLVKYLLDESTDTEKTAVEEWMQAEPGNRKYFDHFKLIWERSKAFAATSTIDEEAAWQRFRSRIKQKPVEKGIVRGFNRIPWMRIAAMVIIVIGFRFLSFSQGHCLHFLRAVSLSVAAQPVGFSLLLPQCQSRR